MPLPRPDLVVQTPSVGDATLETGATFTLSATVANRGDWQSAPTTLRYYRSTDATITTADTEVGTDDVGGLLYPSWAFGWSSKESIDLTAPSAVGTYYYGACSDSVTGESDTTNNCSSSVTVTVVHPPLTVSGSTATSYAENGAGAVATYAATGAPSGATVTWSLSGDDSGDSSISSSGALTFNSSPDYESPTDSDTDNVYSVTVEASATDRSTGTLDVTVTVTDVNEGPALNLD